MQWNIHHFPVFIQTFLDFFWNRHILGIELNLNEIELSNLILKVQKEQHFQHEKFIEQKVDLHGRVKKI